MECRKKYCYIAYGVLMEEMKEYCALVGGVNETMRFQAVLKQRKIDGSFKTS